MALAFFDLDRTLISENSGKLWVRSELRLGYLSRWQAVRAAVWLGRYHLGFGNLDSAVRAAIDSLRGTPECEIRERTLAFYEREVRDLVRPGAHAALREHRARGDGLVLLTTSSNYLSEPVCADLEIEAWLCNRFETTDGVFTGEPVEPLCYGTGKRVLADAYASERGVALADCAFYTDSFSDVSVLEVVGRPVCVNPDPRLARIARKRGWEIADWGVPSGG